MTIHHFAEAQTDVFVPALAVLALAALFGVLPVIFAPTLRRRRGGRGLATLSIVLAAAALVVTAVQAGSEFRALGDERARLSADITRTYGLHLDSSAIGTLVDGGAVRLPGYGPVRFKPVDPASTDYQLVFRTASEKSVFQPLPKGAQA